MVSHVLVCCPDLLWSITVLWPFWDDDSGQSPGPLIQPLRLWGLRLIDAISIYVYRPIHSFTYTILTRVFTIAWQAHTF